MSQSNITGQAVDIRFDARVAIVTGAGGGLGRTYAIELARRGARVIVNDVGCSGSGAGGGESAPADAVVREIEAFGGTAVANYDSVSSPEAGERMVGLALEKFGRLDILISNAGILRTGRFDEVSDSDLEGVVAVNLKGAFHVCRPAFRQMKRQRYGRLLLISSASGAFGHPWQSVYGASKAGLLGLSNVLALEGADFGINSNVLLPAALTRLAGEIAWEFASESSSVAEALRQLEASAGRGERRLEPEWVTPLAVYLVSEHCHATHGIYSAVSGRYARVLIGVTPGWTAAAAATVEDIAAAWRQIEARDGYSEPASVYHEALTASASARRSMPDDE